MTDPLEMINIRRVQMPENSGQVPDTFDRKEILPEDLQRGKRYLYNRLNTGLGSYTPHELVHLALALRVLNPDQTFSDLKGTFITELKARLQSNSNDDFLGISDKMVQSYYAVSAEVPLPKLYLENISLLEKQLQEDMSSATPTDIHQRLHLQLFALLSYPGLRGRIWNSPKFQYSRVLHIVSHELADADRYFDHYYPNSAPMLVWLEIMLCAKILLPETKIQLTLPQWKKLRTIFNKVCREDDIGTTLRYAAAMTILAAEKAEITDKGLVLTFKQDPLPKAHVPEVPEIKTI